MFGAGLKGRRKSSLGVLDWRLGWPQGLNRQPRSLPRKKCPRAHLRTPELVAAQNFWPHVRQSSGRSTSFEGHQTTPTMKADGRT